MATQEQLDLRQKWIEALRSGEYSQGTAVLKRKHEDGRIAYCCLGVLCEIAGASWGDPRTTDGAYHLEVPHGFVEASVPTDIRMLAGLRDDLGRMDDGPALYFLNDSEHRTFSEIADVIESNPPGLFID